MVIVSVEHTTAAPLSAWLDTWAALHNLEAMVDLCLKTVVRVGLVCLRIECVTLQPVVPRCCMAFSALKNFTTEGQI